MHMDCFQLDEIKVFLTDIQFRLDKLDEFYKRADIIFQDCETSKFPVWFMPIMMNYWLYQKKPEKNVVVPLRTRAASQKKRWILRVCEARSNFWIFFRFTLNPGRICSLGASWRTLKMLHKFYQAHLQSSPESTQYIYLNLLTQLLQSQNQVGTPATVYRFNLRPT